MRSSSSSPLDGLRNQVESYSREVSKKEKEYAEWEARLDNMEAQLNKSIAECDALERNLPAIRVQIGSLKETCDEIEKSLIAESSDPKVTEARNSLERIKSKLDDVLAQAK